MQWRLQFEPLFDDFTFFHSDNRSLQRNMGFRSRPFFNEFFADSKIAFSAIGITGTVLLDSANEYSRCPDCLGPRGGYCDEMGISKGDIG